MKKNPFIAGSWVRGQNFYGRQKLVDEILAGSRPYVWVAGTRRLGKTSLLKQIEFLTTEGIHADRYVPLFWDFQGSRNLEGLKESLLESVEDAEERFQAIGVDPQEIEALDLFGGLRLLMRQAKANNMSLLLLCDEVEELISLEQSNPEVLPKLRRFLQRGENVCTVLTATRRLGKLEQSSGGDTSPFLHGFVPPAYLGRLSDDSAKQLISLGNFDAETAAAIMRKTNNHPYLLQLICKRLFENSDFNQVVEDISSDEMIGHFFGVDFQYLDAVQKELLLSMLQDSSPTLADLANGIDRPTDLVIRVLYELTRLGFVRQEDSHYSISNYFFKQWLEREKEQLFSASLLERAEVKQEPKFAAGSHSGSPEVGGTLGSNELLEKLGEGGMGVVFKGRDQKLQRTVAIKVLRARFTDDAEFRERFIREAQAASSMSHPNIATIYQIGEDDGTHYISMEYVEGQPLGRWRETNSQNLAGQFDIAIQTGQALLHAHKKGVVHRDIKPDNILITDEGAAKVLDFGLAKSLAKSDKHLTKAGTTLGTPAYMSPEQASGFDTDHRTDIFSFGIVLYELFTGKLPFDGQYELSILYSLMNEDPAPMREWNPGLPSELDSIVVKALEKDRENRYQTMGELVADLTKLF